MNFIKYSHPISALVFFISVSLPPMLSRTPMLSALAVLGAFTLTHLRGSGIKKRGIFILFFIGMTLINPVFSHNGATVIVVIGSTPITLESLIYGAVTSASLVSVLIFFAIFSNVMTSDKLLSIFGILSPKISLVLSTAIRFIPLFRKRARDIENAGRAMGLYSDDSIIDTARGKLHVISVMITWALEDGIHTADSMASRGYGIGKRTSYSIFRLRTRDILYIILCIILVSPLFILLLTGALDCEFYPYFEPESIDIFHITAYIFYAFLTLLPIITDISEEVKWKFLMSKI